MSNRIDKLLAHWTSNRDKLLWVLATIIETDGSSYRKAGAMMLINDMGQYFGLLSGGCLESDIMRQARRCWDSQQNRIIEYDMREEEDLAWQLGIGCGGMVKILLQPVNQDNHYLQLETLNQALEKRQTVFYQQNVEETTPCNNILCEQLPKASKEGIQQQTARSYFIQKLTPAPLLVVFGGGVDAKPLVAMAAELGWELYLVDPRMGYAKQVHFPGAKHIIRTPFSSLSQASWLGQIDAALVLTHNVKLDGEALALLQFSEAKYIGLLGPVHRTERVLDSANLTRSKLKIPLANPVGLRLGGELPESIALSMLAEVHAVLEKADGQSISNIIKL